MQPRLDALPPQQRQLWPELRSTPSGFALYGGTALALRLAHRESEDFDFFSRAPLDAERLLTEVSYLDRADKVRRAENTLTCLVDRDGPVRVSFFGDGDLSAIPGTVRARLALADAVREVDPESIPHFPARPGLLAPGASS
ncbi:nucleotidyl transferase AbiEii/AbiGii toxin family protein [Candidatus Palauibacter sp.]|uniref:nucleotidyl transferase AbiEii/AbiGii toxin family protein n=1 Tax=Candidatus Palauibacter sp. TaxID=3101350 RepID=UPI003AF2300E